MESTNFNSTTGNQTGSNTITPVTGLFNDRQSAEAAYRTAKDHGYEKDDINVVMTDETRERYFANSGDSSEMADKALEGAGVGSAVGGTLGAIIGAVAAIGTSLILPGVGLVIAGPIAAALAGAGAGGLAGGVVGSLIGMGIPENQAQTYEKALKDGNGIMLSLTPRNQEDARQLAQSWGNLSHGASAFNTTDQAASTMVQPDHGTHTTTQSTTSGSAGTTDAGLSGQNYASGTNPVTGTAGTAGSGYDRSDNLGSTPGTFGGR